MLKQEVLDCLHSKVRSYAIRQIKKVRFRSNPCLSSEEDLRGAVNELQYLCTYDEKRRYESDVLGENYGKKYPSFIIEDMKEYKFWPFVAGKDWHMTSSLRITPGGLLISILEALRELERDKKASTASK